jgi:hypothetical protein
MDTNPPQRLVPQDKRNGREEQDIAAIEREEKINRLRTNEDFEVPYDPPKKRHPFLRRVGRFIGWMVLIVVLTAGGGGTAWYYWLRNEPKGTPRSQQQTATNPTPPPAAVAEPTESFSSAAFLLEFQYPKGWKTSEGADNKITAVSPATQLKTTSGAKQAGQIVFTIQRKQVSLPDFKDGSALAVRESEKIDYSKPSQVQRGSTYLTFVSYATSASKGLDGVYVTGDNGYIKDQYVPVTDIAKSDPLITVTFKGCDDTKCTAATKPLTLAASSWDDAAFAKPIRTMLQSIVVQ